MLNLVRDVAKFIGKDCVVSIRLRVSELKGNLDLQQGYMKVVGVTAAVAILSPTRKLSLQRKVCWGHSL